MPEGLRRLRLERGLTALLALTIFAFACGSSFVPNLQDPGLKARWVLFVLVAAIAGAVALARKSAVRELAKDAWPVALLAADAIVSTAWSVEAQTTFVHALTLAAAIAAGAALARALPPAWLLTGVAAGAVLVVAAGVLYALVHPGQAVFGSRWRGIGQSPNTDAMLCALAVPVTAVGVARLRGRPRLAAGVALVLLAGSVIASGSRGAQIGAFAGLLIAGFAAGRRSLIALAVAAVLFVAASVGASIVQTAQTNYGPNFVRPKKHRHAGVPSPGGLDQELGHGQHGAVFRSVLGSSGRTQAWDGVLQLGDRRRVAGYGFGTEEKVFFDRYYAFQGDNAENSWLGLYLQLGLVGLLLFLAWWIKLARGSLRALRRRDPTAVAAVGLVAAALPITFVESWVYSIGNVASVPFWIGSFVLLREARRGRA